MSIADYFNSLTNDQAIRELAKMGVKFDPAK